MSEVFQETKHDEPNAESGPTAMSNALKELAQKLGNKDKPVSEAEVRQILKEKGVLTTKDSTSVISFPFEKTEEAQKELGREVGTIAQGIIENYQQNKKRISQIDGTISHMSNEKPPQKEMLRTLDASLPEDPPYVLEAKLHGVKQQLEQLRKTMGSGHFSSEQEGGREGDEIFARDLQRQVIDLETRLGRKPQEIDNEENPLHAQSLVSQTNSLTYRSPTEHSSSEEMPAISYNDHDGTVIPMRDQFHIKQEVPEKNEDIARAFLYDETIVRINKEISEVEKKRSRMKTELKDHTTGEKEVVELQKSIRSADMRTSELNKERREHIRNKIRNASPDEINIIKNFALNNVILNQNENYKTEATDALQEINSLIREKESGAEKSTQNIVETPATQEPSLDKQSAQKELAQIEVERTMLKNIRDRALNDEEQKKLEELTARMQTLRGEISLTPIETKPQELIVPEPPHVTESATLEVPQTEVIVEQNNERVSVVEETLVTAKKEPGTPFEKIIAGIKSEDPARAERLLAAIGTTPEQKERIEKLFTATQVFIENTEAIEKTKDHWIVERALKIGGWYRKLPLKYKLAASAVFVGTAGATAALGGAGVGMIMAAAFAGSTGQRMLGSLAVFATVEGILTKRSISNNEVEEKIGGVRTNVLLGALAASGVFFGGKLLADYISTPTETMSGSGTTTDQIKIPSSAPEHVPQSTMTETSPSSPAEAIEQSVQNEYAQKIETVREVLKNEAAQKISLAETLYTVHDGDNLWNIIKLKIPEIQDLDGEGRQSNAIANIIEQIKKDPESFGIRSGNVDSLSAGDTIHLDKIHDVLGTSKISIEGGQSVGIIERAHGLTTMEASRIMENNTKISAWHTAHPDSLLTTETVDKILHGGIDNATGTSIEGSGLTELTKDYTLSMPDAGGRTIEQLSAEALALDTDAVLHADVQTMFGSKGLFGFGFLGSNGEKSIDWLDFKSRAVNEVLEKKFDSVPLGEEGGVQKFGIDSPRAVDKLKGYIQLLVDKSGMNPDQGENVEHFSKRAISAILSNKK